MRLSRIIKQLFSLRDEFMNPLAAGSINGTYSEPGPGIRTVTDTENKLSISGGNLVCAGGKASPSTGDPGVKLGSFARTAGMAIIGKIKISTFGILHFGWGNGTGGIVDSIRLDTTGSTTGVVSGGAVIANVCTLATGTDYYLSVVVRATGAYYFIKGGAFTYWTLIYIGNSGTTTPILPGIYNNAAVYTAESLYKPSTLWLPIPLASDSFNRADGALGSTDGAGQLETTGIGSGGGGKAWTGSTWTISSNKVINNPNLGTELITNSADRTFSSDTGYWSKNANADINVTTAGKAHFSAVLDGQAGIFRPALPVIGTCYQAQYDISGQTGGAIKTSFGNTTGPARTTGTAIDTGIQTANTNFYLVASGTTTIDLDNVSLKPLVLSELFATVLASTADVIADIALTIVTGTQAGIVVNLDSTTNPQNFIVAYHDGTNTVLIEYVSGTPTVKISAATTYVASAVMRIIREGTTCRLFYNNAQVGTTQTMTANTNTRHGIYSTSSGNTLDNFMLRARGTSGEYAFLDRLS